MDDDVIVCRCEEVTVGDVRRAIAQGATDLTGVKRRTRAGMGLCQGRTCESLITRILAQELSKRTADVPAASARPPANPVTFGVLAGETRE
ncbi:MAG: (2Fe-2S)-binding protein [Bacillota bacterium]